MSNGIGAIVAIVTAIIGVAIIAALISQKAQTAQVITSGGNAFSSILGTALGPITGSSTSGLTSSANPINFNGNSGTSPLTYL